MNNLIKLILSIVVIVWAILGLLYSVPHIISDYVITSLFEIFMTVLFLYIIYSTYKEKTRGFIVVIIYCIIDLLLSTNAYSQYIDKSEYAVQTIENLVIISISYILIKNHVSKI